MGGFSFTGPGGELFELMPAADGSLDVSASQDGWVVSIAIPAGERSRLAAVARPVRDLEVDWGVATETVLREQIIRYRAAATVGGLGDG